MNILAIILSVFICAIIISCLIYAFYTEPRDFNDGICTYCGSKLRHFDTDSGGGRGYCCDNCGRTIWISWFADRNFK